MSLYKPTNHDSKTTLKSFLQHKPLVYDFKITLEGLDPTLLMTGLQQL